MKGRLTAAEKRYAISLLAYRLGFPVQSILAHGSGERRVRPGERSLVSLQILHFGYEVVGLDR